MDSVYGLINADVKKHAQSRAVLDGLTLTQVIEALLADYANQKIKINVGNPSTYLEQQANS